MAGIQQFMAYAIGIVALAVTVVTGTAVLGGFKQTGLVNNTTTNSFITGLAYFGLFIGVVVLGVVGKVIIGMYTHKPED